MLGNDAVGKFVEEDGREEEKAGQDAHGPMLCVGPKWMLLLELRGDDVGDGRKNENPSGVEIDANSEKRLPPQSSTCLLKGLSKTRNIDGQAEPSFRAGLIEKGGAVCVPVDNGQINSCTERNRQFYLESILRFLACEPLRPVRHAVCQPPQFARSFHVVSPYLSID